MPIIENLKTANSYIYIYKSPISKILPSPQKSEISIFHKSSFFSSHEGMGLNSSFDYTSLSNEANRRLVSLPSIYLSSRQLFPPCRNYEHYGGEEGRNPGLHREGLFTKAGAHLCAPVANNSITQDAGQ